MFGYLHAQPLCRGPATDRIWRLRMLMLLTGAGEGANRNTPLRMCVLCSSTGQNYGFFLFVCFLNACKVNHSFLHLLVAQYDLWFLLIRFPRTWHRSTLCLCWITYTCWTWFCFKIGELCCQMTTQTALRLTFIILMFPLA